MSEESVPDCFWNSCRCSYRCFFLWQHGKSAGSATVASSLQTASPTSVDVPPLTQKYQDSKNGFSFNYPEGYSVTEANTDANSRTLLIQNASTSDGIQITLSPFTDSDTTITQEKIQADIPDMKVENPQPLAILGQSGDGLAFESDNQAFNGDSREVWFVFHGYLYQVSTYAKDDPLLKAVFGTWVFGK